MKVVLQRVTNAFVSVENEIVGKIGYGLVLLVGFTKEDNEEDINYLVDKIINLRIFDDEQKVMNKSLLDVNGQVLSISQFTLYADSKKGRRPSYDKALPSLEAKEMYHKFNLKLQEQNIVVKQGIFQSDMQVTLTNDGPVTIILESR